MIVHQTATLLDPSLSVLLFPQIKEPTLISLPEQKQRKVEVVTWHNTVIVTSTKLGKALVVPQALIPTQKVCLETLARGVLSQKNQ